MVEIRAQCGDAICPSGLESCDSVSIGVTSLTRAWGAFEEPKSLAKVLIRRLEAR